LQVIAPRHTHAHEICDEVRTRRFGYRLRCHEPDGHDGEHRWTPELLHPRTERSARDAV